MHQPGQYLSVKVSIPELNLYQPRHYNISPAPDGHYYRISVKKEAGTPDKEDGRVSNYLHNVLQEGDVLVASSPAGDFVLNTTQHSPLVLLSGGVGKTPFVSIMGFLSSENEQRQVRLAHACRSEQVHAFRDQIKAWDAEHDWIGRAGGLRLFDAPETYRVGKTGPAAETG